jgi:hypothetical protein
VYTGTVTILAGLQGIHFYYISFNFSATATTYLQTSLLAQAIIYYSKCVGGMTYSAAFSSMYFYYSYVTSSNGTYAGQNRGEQIFTTSKVDAYNVSSYCIAAIRMGYTWLRAGAILHGGAVNALVEINGLLDANGATNYIRFRNSAIGIKAQIGGKPATTSVVYEGCTNNVLWVLGGAEQYMQLAEQASAPTSAAGYGYIYIDDAAPTELYFEDDTGGTEQISSSYMLFIWDKVMRQYLRNYRVREVSDFVVEGNSLSIWNGNKVEDLTKVDYRLYPKQSFTPLYEDAQVGATEDGKPIYEKRIAWQTIDSLSLRDFTADELPHSMHIAALKAVDVVSKKATVVRKFMGVNYEVPNCYVSLGALEAYQAGKIKLFNPAYAITAPQNADCFVMVYFISETPYDEAIEIPVIVDKVVK